MPDRDQLYVGGDFNGNCGNEETVGKYGVGESNKAGDNVVAFTSDCKFTLGESVTNQHRPLVCTLICSKAIAYKWNN